MGINMYSNLIVGLVVFVLETEPYKCTTMSTTVTTSGELSTTQFRIPLQPLLPKNKNKRGYLQCWALIKSVTINAWKQWTNEKYINDVVKGCHCVHSL